MFVCASAFYDKAVFLDEFSALNFYSLNLFSLNFAAGSCLANNFASLLQLALLYQFSSKGFGCYAAAIPDDVFMWRKMAEAGKSGVH